MYKKLLVPKFIVGSYCFRIVNNIFRSSCTHFLKDHKISYARTLTVSFTYQNLLTDSRHRHRTLIWCMSLMLMETGGGGSSSDKQATSPPHISHDHYETDSLSATAP